MIPNELARDKDLHLNAYRIEIAYSARMQKDEEIFGEITGEDAGDYTEILSARRCWSCS